jgi:hypothetical protein
MNNKIPNAPSNPQLLYKVDDAVKQDFRLKLSAVCGLFGGLILIGIYLVIFWLYLISKPSLANPSNIAGIVFQFFILLLLISAPIVIMVIGLKTAYGHYAKFAKAFYKVPDEVDIKPIIQRKLFGLPYDNPSNPSFLLISSDKLDAKNLWAASMGGPAKLIIMDGYAV